MFCLFIIGLIRDVDMIKGKSVLDVGCGVGLASLTAAALHVRHVHAYVHTYIQIELYRLISNASTITFFNFISSFS